MTYYRLALQNHQTLMWSWKTTALTSLHAVFQLLRSYSAMSQDRIRVFTSSSKEDLREMLSRENNGLASASVTAAQFLHDRNMCVPQRTHSQSEHGTTERAVQQSTAIATYAPLYEHSTATGSPDGSNLSLLDKKRMEIEYGPGGDHDTPYRFSLPVSTPQLLAWTLLHARIQAGELQL